jgi:hypothetical protein
MFSYGVSSCCKEQSKFFGRHGVVQVVRVICSSAVSLGLNSLSHNEHAAPVCISTNHMLMIAPHIVPVGFISSSNLNHDMALSSGIYIIENVKYRNCAMLLDRNNKGEVVAGSFVTPDVGEKVRL